MTQEDIKLLNDYNNLDLVKSGDFVKVPMGHINYAVAKILSNNGFTIVYQLLNHESLLVQATYTIDVIRSTYATGGTCFKILSKNITDDQHQIL